MEKKQNSFLDYLESDKFYDKIYISIFSWCKNNKSLLLEKIEKSYNVSYLGHIEEDMDLDYINVWIDRKEDTKIEFDLAVEVSVDVEGVSGKHHDRDLYNANIWVMVYCSGSLYKKLNDFRILGIEEFNKSKPKKPLSGDFVPYIKKSDYDQYANEILDKYYFNHHPEARTNPIPINVDELATNMGLSVCDTSISKNRSIFGQVFFADAEAKLFNPDKDLYEKRQIKKDTILVDSSAAYLRSFGSRNMTIAHECVHSYYHRHAFLFAQMFNEKLHFIQCQVNGVMKNGESNTTADWMEIQANGLAPYILMPKESFEDYAKNLFEHYNQFSRIGSNSINLIIDELAKTYEVTIYATRKRLIDLGYEQAIGAYNWVDGHYVRPYSFKKGSLAYDETYTVSYKDVYNEVVTNPVIAMSALMNDYVFVENHLCINHPNYIEKDRDGNLILSDYALIHMDECCVKFKYKTITGFKEGSELGLICYLSRDTSKEIEFDLELSKLPEKKTDESLFKERYRVHTENVAEVSKAIIDMTFGEIIAYLMKYLDIKLYELEIDSGVNERTIRRYTNGENKKPDKRTVVALLRALNLPPRICDIAVKQAGISFINGDKEDNALLNAMMTLRNGSASDANRFMKLAGFEPLTKEE